jgi:secondary thiamine-phosphate synthase enzyme
MVHEFNLNTERQNFYNITGKVAGVVAESGVTDGAVVVYCPHTTAGITINENADPDVVRDMLYGLDKAYPDRSEFRHCEGNSSAHLKASAVGSSQLVIVENGKLLLGTWQGIYFCEFDGPRRRRFYVKILTE